ncbi:hypothetical protein M427DRAFT_144602 [Gonapodya prolifera JEL478]|uniref:Uncharacterized protein n=1 Tax=Gonapodya prolifera (strain JEL478) TaxID=1344416 RepID=A0A139AJ16_GONPJ|nr:hypothetical protein M427DRAFT_144602 [Gonapodya prolifera JEL478]|eukprot:KXS16777.1 hypothetical protein M427DRAFT_144602 [Gonapodya prolifera JEL478]
MLTAGGHSLDSGVGTGNGPTSPRRRRPTLHEAFEVADVLFGSRKIDGAGPASPVSSPGSPIHSPPRQAPLAQSHLLIPRSAPPQNRRGSSTTDTPVISPSATIIPASPSRPHADDDSPPPTPPRWVKTRPRSYLAGKAHAGDNSGGGARPGSIAGSTASPARESPHLDPWWTPPSPGAVQAKTTTSSASTHSRHSMAHSGTSTQRPSPAPSPSHTLVETPARRRESSRHSGRAAAPSPSDQTPYHSPYHANSRRSSPTHSRSSSTGSALGAHSELAQNHSKRASVVESAMTPHSVPPPHKTNDSRSQKSQIHAKNEWQGGTILSASRDNSMASFDTDDYEIDDSPEFAAPPPSSGFSSLNQDPPPAPSTSPRYSPPPPLSSPTSTLNHFSPITRTNSSGSLPSVSLPSLNTPIDWIEAFARKAASGPNGRLPDRQTSGISITYPTSRPTSTSPSGMARTGSPTNPALRQRRVSSPHLYRLPSDLVMGGNATTGAGAAKTDAVAQRAPDRASSPLSSGTKSGYQPLAVRPHQQVPPPTSTLEVPHPQGNALKRWSMLDGVTGVWKPGDGDSGSQQGGGASSKTRKGFDERGQARGDAGGGGKGGEKASGRRRGSWDKEKEKGCNVM